MQSEIDESQYHNKERAKTSHDNYRNNGKHNLSVSYYKTNEEDENYLEEKLQMFDSMFQNA